MFGPRDRRGLIAGARTGQLIVVASGLVCALVSLRAVHGAGRAALAIAVLVVAIASVTWPIGGRTLDEWVPVALGFSTRSLTGANRSVVRIETTRRERRHSPVFDEFDVSSVTLADGRAIGSLVDRRAGSASALVELGGESFALLSDAERTRRVDAWAGVLASLSRNAGPLYRVQWIERTIPDVAAGLRNHLERSLDASSHKRPPPLAVQSYRDLVSSETRAALAHECFLAVSVRTPKGRTSKLRDDRGRPVAWAVNLADEATLLSQRCRQAGLPARGVVSQDGLEALIRRGFDAFGSVTSSPYPWPVAVETTWGAIRTDDLWHATFWVAEWPRHEVASDFLLPLLVGVRGRRTVTLVMAPVPPMRAVKRAEHARTSRLADAELRRQHGFAHTARARSEDETVRRRELELAAGHSAFRFSAYVTVSGRERQALESSCREVVDAAALCGLDLRRLYGSQAAAFCFTLPAARGCG